MSGVIIRYLQQKDLFELVDLCAQHAAYEKATYEPEGKAEALGKHLLSETSPASVLVVEETGKIIGYASYMKQFSTWDAAYYLHMDCLFLTKASRGKGIGQQLMETLKKEAKAMGCEMIQWQTPQFNERAIKFYDRLGAISKSKERYFWTV